MSEIHFDEQDDAAELIGALESEGYTTRWVREAFAGEEDWEDRAWLLLVDPFDDRVTDMVDTFGGWLAGGRLPGDDQLAPEPPNLPQGPKHLKT